MDKRSASICVLVCVLVISLPLAITSTIMGALHPGSCDNTDIMGLNISQYLLGLGISSLIFIVALVLCLALGFLNVAPACMAIAGLVVTILTAVFGFIWFIVGAIILFRGNIACISAGSTSVIYALVMWCISAVSIVKSCLFGTHQKSTSA